MKKPGFLCLVKAFIFVAVLLLEHTTLVANDFYVDPIHGSMAGDGSAANPWSTLQEVFSNNLIESQRPAVYPYNGTLTARNPGAPVKAGDTIKLLSGYHGDVTPTGYFNSDVITIEAETGNTPTLSGFHLRGGKNWTLRGLTVSPEFAGVVDTGSIVRFESHGFQGPVSNITLEDSLIYSASDTSSWNQSDWLSKAATGVQFVGDHFVARNNTIKNVDFGISTGGDNILADHNSIENFSGDGMRGGGDDVTFQYNTIKWSYDVDGNHDDGIQFYQGHGVPSHDVILRGNYILSYADPARPLTHGSQGLGNFDGPYVNWLIENNVVMVSTYHGISLYGGVDSTVINNTVFDISGQSSPWILLDHNTGSTMRNNLAANLKTTGSTDTTSDHNFVLNSNNVDDIFVDWQNGDLRLKPGSIAIDAGNGDLAPDLDILGNARPFGSQVDIGAYEYIAVPECSTFVLGMFAILHLFFRRGNQK